MWACGPMEMEIQTPQTPQKQPKTTEFHAAWFHSLVMSIPLKRQHHKANTLLPLVLSHLPRQL